MEGGPGGYDPRQVALRDEHLVTRAWRYWGSCRNRHLFSLQVQRSSAIGARRVRVEKSVHLLLEQASLEGAQKLFGLG